MPKYEPLIGKKVNMFEDDGYELFKGDDIKSACNFFLRYKDRPSLFWKEQKKHRKELTIINEEWFKLKESDTLYDWTDFNDWLFIFSFKDVLKVKSEKY